MKDKEITIEEAIEFLKDKGVPSFLLDEERIKSNQPLTIEEQKIFMTHMVNSRRNIVANRYLTSCMERFGPGLNETFAFRHENIVVDLSVSVIELLLIKQIEEILLEGSPNGIFALWKFYEGNELKEREEGHTWMQDFIDSVLIDGANLLISSGDSQLIH